MKLIFKLTLWYLLISLAVFLDALLVNASTVRMITDNMRGLRVEDAEMRSGGGGR